MGENWTKFKDFVAKYWLVGTSLIIAIMYFLLQKRGDTISDLQAQVRRQKLENELKSLKDIDVNDTAKFNQGRDAYLALKRRHPEYFND